MKFDFGELTADDFERICFLIVQTEFPDIVRLKNPDGGIEFGLPGSDGVFVRCWQAKRYTGDISWKKCEASLDSAVNHFGMPHYTFCFAYDLTAPQHKTFRKRLERRNKAVRVDYWNHSKLESVLLTTPQGERIANHFYEDRADNTRRFMAAVEAGGSLDSGADVMKRLDAIAQFLRRNDPHYHYVTTIKEAGEDGPGLTPATLIAVEVGDGETVTRVDAVPRNLAGLHAFPEGTLYVDNDEQAERLDRFFRRGGGLQLEGVRVELRNLPPLFESMPGTKELAEAATVVMSAPLVPVPDWQARLSVETDRGQVEVDIVLTQVDPPDDFDAALEGDFAGLSVTMLLRTTPKERGELVSHWSYSYPDDHTLRERAQVVAMMDALAGTGTIVIEDRGGIWPKLTQALGGREADQELAVLHKLLESLVVIEDWTGHAFSVPDNVSAEDVRSAIQAAQVIRDGGSQMNVDPQAIVLSVEEFDAIPKDQRWRLDVKYGGTLLGDEVWIGELQGELVDIETETDRMMDGGEEKIELTLRPTTDAGRHPFFKLVRIEPAGSKSHG